MLSSLLAGLLPQLASQVADALGVVATRLLPLYAAYEVVMLVGHFIRYAIDEEYAAEWDLGIRAGALELWSDPDWRARAGIDVDYDDAYGVEDEFDLMDPHYIDEMGDRRVGHPPGEF